VERGKRGVLSPPLSLPFFVSPNHQTHLSSSPFFFFLLRVMRREEARKRESRFSFFSPPLPVTFGHRARRFPSFFLDPLRSHSFRQKKEAFGVEHPPLSLLPTALLFPLVTGAVEYPLLFFPLIALLLRKAFPFLFFFPFPPRRAAECGTRLQLEAPLPFFFFFLESPVSSFPFFLLFRWRGIELFLSSPFFPCRSLPLISPLFFFPLSCDVQADRMIEGREAEIRRVDLLSPPLPPFPSLPLLPSSCVRWRKDEKDFSPPSRLVRLRSPLLFLLLFFLFFYVSKIPHQSEERRVAGRTVFPILFFFLLKLDHTGPPPLFSLPLRQSTG